MAGAADVMGAGAGLGGGAGAGGGAVGCGAEAAAGAEFSWAALSCRTANTALQMLQRARTPASGTLAGSTR
jgi:hypothetical protein